MENDFSMATNTLNVRNNNLNVLTFFPLTGGCSEGLGAFRFFFKQQVTVDPMRLTLGNLTINSIWRFSSNQSMFLIQRFRTAFAPDGVDTREVDMHSDWGEGG